jgi:hypothetical protein
MRLRLLSSALSRLSSGFHYSIFFRESCGSDFARISKYSINPFPACSRWGPLFKKLSVADISPGMTEQIVRRGTSSQLKNFGV